MWKLLTRRLWKICQRFVWSSSCHLVEGIVDEEEEGTVELHHLARTHAEHECWRGRRRLGPFLRNLKQFFCGIMSMITFIRFLWSSCLQNYFILAFTFCFPELCSIFHKYVWAIRKIHYFWIKNIYYRFSRKLAPTHPEDSFVLQRIQPELIPRTCHRREIFRRSSRK